MNQEGHEAASCADGAVGRTGRVEGVDGGDLLVRGELARGELVMEVEKGEWRLRTMEVEKGEEGAKVQSVGEREEEQSWC